MDDLARGLCSAATLRLFLAANRRNFPPILNAMKQLINDLFLYLTGVLGEVPAGFDVRCHTNFKSFDDLEIMNIDASYCTADYSDFHSGLYNGDEELKKRITDAFRQIVTSKAKGVNYPSSLCDGFTAHFSLFKRRNVAFGDLSIITDDEFEGIDSCGTKFTVHLRKLPTALDYYARTAVPA